MSFHTLTIRVGRALGLPEVFFKPLPYTDILDQNFKLDEKKGTKRKRPKVKKSQSKDSSDVSQLVTVEGILIAGMGTPFAIGQRDIVITPSTWVVGELAIGAKAKVRFKAFTDDTATAHSVVIF